MAKCSACLRRLGRLERNLYSSDLGRPYRASGPASGIRGAGNTPDNPIYEDTRSRDLLSKYVGHVMQRMREYCADKLGFIPNFGNLRVEVRKLPEYEAVFTGRDGRQRRRAGKTFGAYSPRENKIYIDPSLTERGASDRERLRGKGLKIPDVYNLIAHETAHYLQHMTGAIRNAADRHGRYAREHIEGAAAYLSDLLFGDSGVYRRQRDEFEQQARRKGLKRAFINAA